MKTFLLLMVLISAVYGRIDYDMISKYENIEVDINIGAGISDRQEAKIIRQMENSGKYRGKARLSTGAGAYMILRGTRRFIFRNAKLVDSVTGKGLNFRNWHLKRNQDKMYKWYMNYITHYNRNLITEGTIFTNYMQWQRGPGGGRVMYKALKFRTGVSHKTIASIETNVGRSEKRALQIYLMHKLRSINSEYGFKMSKKWLSNGYASWADYRYMLNKHVPKSMRKEFLRQASNVYVQTWGKHFENKIRRNMKVLGL